MKKILLLLLFSFLLSSCKKERCYSLHQKWNNINEVYGLDVSHHQGKINWKKVKKDGLVYVFIKATQGINYKDNKFDFNRLEAAENCVHSGAYHFYVAGESPQKQAENFIKAVDSLKGGNLPPVLDLESLGMQKKVSTKEFQKNTLIWLEEVEKAFGVKPIIYTCPSFAKKYLNNPKYGSYFLWIAEYSKTRKEPKVPKVWKDKGWLFWQRSERKTVEGVTTKVDYDVFNGNGKDLRSLLIE